MIAALLLCLGAAFPGAEQALTREQPSASEQSSSPAGNSAKWELDLQAGGIGGGSFAGGSPSFPDPSVEFLTFTGAPSRRVSSWYFGDGAALLSQAVQPFGLITPLDRIIYSPFVERMPGATVGVKLSRRLTSRTRAEISVDYHFSRLALDDSVVGTIEASRIGFLATFKTFPFLATSATSTAVTQNRAGREVTSTGGITIDLKRNGRIVPFATGAAGVIARSSRPLSVTMQGEYVLGNIAPPILGSRQIVERDNVSVRYELARRDWVVSGGGGIRYALSQRWFAKLEARVHLSPNSLRISVDASPQTVPAPPGAGSAVVYGTTPALQFANAGQNRSTLSGPPLENFTTFRGSGVQRQVSITAGLGWRF